MRTTTVNATGQHLLATWFLALAATLRLIGVGGKGITAADWVLMPLVIVWIAAVEAERHRRGRAEREFELAVAQARADARHYWEPWAA